MLPPKVLNIYAEQNMSIKQEAFSEINFPGTVAIAKGESVFQHCGSLTCGGWPDKRDVLFISTLYKDCQRWVWPSCETGSRRRGRNCKQAQNYYWLQSLYVTCRQSRPADGILCLWKEIVEMVHKDILAYTRSHKFFMLFYSSHSFYLSQSYRIHPQKVSNGACICI